MGDEENQNLPRVQVQPARKLPRGVIYQRIRIERIEQLTLIFGDGAMIQRTGVSMEIKSKGDTIKVGGNAGIVSGGDTTANDAVITVSESTTVNQGFEKILAPLVDAMKAASLSNNQTVLMNNYINLLRDEAAKAQEKRDKGGISMALEGLKGAVGLVPGLSSVWTTIGPSILKWFSSGPDTLNV